MGEIRDLPETIDLLVGGKKIRLCHSPLDYNNGNVVISTEGFDKVLQGHIHFKNTDGIISVLRGAGIGDVNGNSKNAYYMVITENPDGGYSIEEKYVPFDTYNLGNSINISDLSQEDKNKIFDWSNTGGTIKRRWFINKK